MPTECFVCSGRGIVTTEKECFRCEGKGKIITKVEQIQSIREHNERMHKMGAQGKAKQS